MTDSARVVSVLGGYGVFGGRVAEGLARDPDCRVRVMGRSIPIGWNFAHRIGAEFQRCDLGDRDALRRVLAGSFLVIHAAGPFQGIDYQVAEFCLEAGAHYLDLADGREFVSGISRLDAEARQRGLLVASGASSAPAITSALIASVTTDFSAIEDIHTALCPGNQNPRGAATIAAVLSYLGRTIRVWKNGRWVERPGWGDVERLQLPARLGRRRVHNCDVPDLELFPALFGAQTVRFSAGLELNLLNYSLSLCALASRWFGLDLSRHARRFHSASMLLSPFGTTSAALAIWLKGKDHAGIAIERRIALVTDYDGPATPSSAAIVLAKKILHSGPPRTGAMPCVGLLSLDEILDHLNPLGIRCVRGDESGWQSYESRRSAGGPIDAPPDAS
jgi:hypothetical protein